MADKQYLNAFMNNSATIRDVLAADVTDAPHKAVTYDAEGKLILPPSASFSATRRRTIVACPRLEPKSMF